MRRRDFLQRAAVMPLALGWPAWAMADGRPRRLLLVELSGGNDGLNTVVPYADPNYARLRPQIAISRDEVLPLDEHLGLNPALAPLLPAWKDGQLAVVQGLGYAQPNRSHFRSIEIWDTGSDAAQVETAGWLTRIGTASALGAGYSADAVVIGRNAGPLAGGGLQPVVMEDAQSFLSEAGSLEATRSQTPNPTLRHVLQVQAQILRAANGLATARPAAPGGFPGSAIGKDLAEAARLLIGAPLTPIVKVALVGFDTHVAQRRPHERLLGELAEGLAALRLSLTEAGVWRDTLVMTYSEFGRRVAENGSRGTDHGSASVHLVLGGAVKGGVYGERPDLAQLEGGDLRVTTDYRCLYNTVLGRWWGLGAAQIDAARHKALPLV